MAVDSGASLSGLAGDILREAVRVYYTEEFDRLVVGYNPVLAGWNTGMFTAGDVTGSFKTIGFAAASMASDVSLKKVFRLGRRLPAVRLPAAAELAAQARTVPLIAKLEALASWLGQAGRPVTVDRELPAADAAEAARAVGIAAGYLPYLWDYARTARWVEFQDDRDGVRAVPGFTAWRWTGGDDVGTLRAWTVVFAAVLARALEVGARLDPRAARKLRFEGQGVVVAMLLFLDRRTGMSLAAVRDLVRAGALGGRKSARAGRWWDSWTSAYGDPVRWLFSELAELGAVDVPAADDGVPALAPLALWGLREQLRLEGIEIPRISTSREQLRAADLVALAESVPEAEFDAEATAWMAARGAEQAARDLLAFAALSGPQPRLVAVNLVRGIGPEARRAWRDAMQRPELRGYARIALADLPQNTQPLVLDADPDDLAWVATDVLASACADDDPDPEDIAAHFADAVPPGEALSVIDQMSRSSHPDAAGVLTVLGRYHPDRRVAKAARRAARVATGDRPEALSGRVPARTASR